MKKNHIIILMALAFFIGACGSGSSDEGGSSADKVETPKEKTEEEQRADDLKGIGKFKEVTLSANLDVEMALKGSDVYDLKCSACHKLTGSRLVGPSWEGVTDRRDPAWILNFITNVDEMLAKDPAAIAQLEECLIRMPNQNLSDDDAYAVLEFMRQNDGVN